MMGYLQGNRVRERKFHALIALLAFTGCEGQISPVYVANDASVNARGDVGPFLDGGELPGGNEGGDSRLSVRIISPEENALVGRAAVTVSATVSAIERIERVEFYVSEQLFAADYEAPYDALWPAGQFPSGLQMLRAQAVTVSGQVATATRTVQLDADSPVLRWDLPAVNAVVATTSTRVHFSASDQRGIASLSLLVDEREVLTTTASEYSAVYDFGESGEFSLEVTATDLAGNETRGSSRILIVDLPPSAQITAPLQNEVLGGVLRLRTNVRDDFAIGKVTWFLNQTLLYETSTMPYDFDWNSCGEPDGDKRLRLQVEDSRGRMTEVSQQIRLDNSTSTISVSGQALTRQNKIAWATCDDGTSQYQVYFATQAGVDRTSQSMMVGNVSRFSHLNLMPDTEYFYRVGRINAGVPVGQLSNEVRLKTSKEYVALLDESNQLRAVRIGLDGFSDQWSLSLSGSSKRPEWSPDGRSIAFSHTSSATVDAVTRVVSTSTPSVTLFTTPGIRPAWDQTGAALMTFDAPMMCLRYYEVASGTETCSAESLSVEQTMFQPSTSESRFVFRTGTDLPTGELWLRDLNATRALLSTSVARFVWVEQGAAVAAIIEQSNSRCDLAYLPIMGMSAGAGNYLIQGIDCSAQLHWSQTEERIFFWDRNSGVTRIFAVETTGGVQRPLAQFMPRMVVPGVVYDFDLSFDEKILGLLAQSNLGQWQLWVAPTDGSTVTSALLQQEAKSVRFGPTDNLAP